MIELGREVRDRITEFQGVAVARTTRLFGATQIAVQSHGLSSGVPVAEQWFEEPRLSYVNGDKIAGFET